MTHNRDASSSPEPEGRVITIGWQVVILPIVLVLVLAGGFFIGSRLTGTPSVQTAAPVVVPPATQAIIGGGTLPDGSQVIEIPSQGLADRYDPDVVYDLDRRPHPLLGQQAPDFTATVVGSDESMTLSDLRGRPVILDFWATWCPPCRVEMPWFQQAYEDYGDDGLMVIGLDVGEKVEPSLVDQTIQSFVDGMGLTFPILKDTDDFAIQRSYSVVGYPTAFLIDADGIVVDFHQSMFPNYVTLQSRLAPILPAGAEGAAESSGAAGGEG